MSLHLAGWYQSVDPGGNATALNAIPDERLFTSGKQIRVNELTMIAAMFSIGTTASGTELDAYLYSPTINIMGDSYVIPENTHATSGQPNNSLMLVQDLTESPIKLAYEEYIRAYNSANPAAAGPQGVFMLMTDGIDMAIPPGPVITWRGTFAAPPSTGQWAPVVPTYESELPPGDYAIVGGRCQAATTMAWRINTRQGKQWRPGGIISPTSGQMPAMPYNPGEMGVWGVFPYTQLPTLEICANTAATGSFYLNIVRMTETPVRYRI